MKTDAKLMRIFFTMMLCFAVGSLIMCLDLRSVEKKNTQWMKEHPDYTVGYHKYSEKYEQEHRFWEWDLGNSYVSASEHAVMLLSLFFGFMRTIDLIKRFREIEKERAWAWFWNFCEDNIDDNNY